MKRLILILMVVAMVFTFGCSKEWMAHDTIYKTNEHMVFSLWGYKNVDKHDLCIQTRQDGWWGEPIEVD